MPVVIATEQPPPTPVDPATLVPETCEWALWNYRNALDGLRAVSSGVRKYKIGTRETEYYTVAEQGKVVDYWRKQVELWCGVDAIPSAISGRDSACRIVPRDL